MTGVSGKAISWVILRSYLVVQGAWKPFAGAICPLYSLKYVST